MVPKVPNICCCFAGKIFFLTKYENLVCIQIHEDKNDLNAFQHVDKRCFVLPKIIIDRHNHRSNDRKRRIVQQRKWDLDAPTWSAEVKFFQQVATNRRDNDHRAGWDSRSNDYLVKRHLWSASTACNHTRKLRDSPDESWQEATRVYDYDIGPHIKRCHQAPSSQQCMYLSGQSTGMSFGCQFVDWIPLIQPQKIAGRSQLA